MHSDAQRRLWLPMSSLDRQPAAHPPSMPEVSQNIDEHVPSFNVVFSIPPGLRPPTCRGWLGRRRRLRLLRHVASPRGCCKQDCCRGVLRRPGALPVVQQWGKAWHALQPTSRRNALLRYLRERPVTRGKVDWQFLGHTVCRRGFQLLTGLSSWMLQVALAQHRAGEQFYQHKGYDRLHVVMNQMHGALWSLTMSLRERMPLKDTDPDEIVLPLHHKIFLFRLLKVWHDCRVKRGEPPLLERDPNYQTMLAVLRRPEFKKLRFHRVVDMGRCPLCSMLQYKCLTADPGTRPHWQSLAAQHQMLQRAQKTAYATGRQQAAVDFPSRELYMGMDGGSGFDFVLPHLAPADMEGPSKALAGSHSVPMKVMNGLVHGDHRSHVVLSPGVIIGGACHVCEVLMIMVNTAYEEHGDVPRTITSQLDNAPANHNILVLVFSGLYVLEQVTESSRVRFELEHHAHDIYDAFHAIHGSRVRRSTFYHHEELLSIIREAHEPAKLRASGCAASSGMGHDVLVSNLWKIRDLWEWLAPGYRNEKTRLTALTRGAFVNYDRLSKYHDFLLKKEAASTPSNIRVGLWAKRYMSCPESEYKFLGTVFTTDMFRKVVGSRTPPELQLSKADQKIDREHRTVDKLRKLSQGLLQGQFSAARLADATAMCERNWGHFQNSGGELPADGRRSLLPAELAAKMLADGKRGMVLVPTTSCMPLASGSAGSLLELVGKEQIGMPRQRVHTMADYFCLARGRDVPLVALYGQQPRTDAAFLAQSPAVGGYVATRRATHSALAQACPQLKRMPFWVWRVLHAYQPGDSFPRPVQGLLVATEPVFEAQVHAASDPDTCRGSLEPCWEELAGGQVMRTMAAKLKARARRQLFQQQGGKRNIDKSDNLLIPLTAFLRPGNLIGGGFHVTPARHVPGYVHQFIMCRLGSQSEPAEDHS
ncbi:unnamed protein product [Polarella glacialis]|uniref:DUF7869 domain-containing protein n=1 Tax=Polarella glacialis TaxID=89957 RepID=A0A813IN19_POLGL|nr:unnamed protein product [Polarella glacialis]